ncbi:unnamed protein product [Prorocentrum cordatum]|uniref:Uncharacterized protein n=1 Tax=Prorocentrum cordatum TaxID=2364126 RepID=A0ABN9PD45_9DINO|nr:unnamed protein product [Polarella glacialis]
MVISGQRCMLSLTERGGPWTLLGSGATMGSAPNCASPRAKFCGCVGSRASAAVELGREIRDRRGDLRGEAGPPAGGVRREARAGRRPPPVEARQKLGPEGQNNEPMPLRQGSSRANPPVATRAPPERANTSEGHQHRHRHARIPRGPLGGDAAARRAAAASLGALGLLVRLVVGLVPGPLQQRLLGEDVHGAGLVLGRR